jgi:tripartite-type tricarboxylate transporter receptor subunit TctC
MSAPAAAPPAVVAKLHDDLKSVVAAPQTRRKFAELGVIPIESPPVPTLQAYVTSEIGRWGKVVEHAGLAGSE